MLYNAVAIIVGNGTQDCWQQYYSIKKQITGNSVRFQQYASNGSDAFMQLSCPHAKTFQFPSYIAV